MKFFWTTVYIAIKPGFDKPCGLDCIIYIVTIITDVNVALCGLIY